MLAKSDTDINQFLALFANAGINVAFLVPTETGYVKSIMDATTPVRKFLAEEGIHNYETQKQGPDNKVMYPAYFATSHGLVETVASLYRPNTKDGDPRIWFKGLKRYCVPCNLLALFHFQERICIINFSEEDNRNSLINQGFLSDMLKELQNKNESIANELLLKLRRIHSRGFIPSVTFGDPGVGDTLENALGIKRNNSKNPDYKGIELKCSRLTRNGKVKTPTRQNLFSKTPDTGLSYSEIVEKYGKMQVPKQNARLHEPIMRLQLYDTLSTQRLNAYGLGLSVDSTEDILEMIYGGKGLKDEFVASWDMQTLRETLLKKHPETFWVKANSEVHDNKEFFRYDHVMHTKRPNTSLLEPLLNAGKITVDLAAHFEPDGKYRDHGVLFKMKPDDVKLLFGSVSEYDL